MRRAFFCDFIDCEASCAEDIVHVHVRHGSRRDGVYCVGGMDEARSCICEASCAGDKFCSCSSCGGLGCILRFGMNEVVGRPF